MATLSPQLFANQQFIDVVEFLPDATFVLDDQHHVVAWNQAIENFSGIDRQAVLGKGLESYRHILYGENQPALIDLLVEQQDKVMPQFVNLQQDHHGISAEEFLPNANEGSGAYVWTSVIRLHDQAGRYCGAVQSMRDITAQKLSERRVQKVNRALRTLSAVNKALVQARSEKELLNAIVSIVTSMKGYRVAWIGYLDIQVRGQIQVVAQSGFDGKPSEIRTICDQKRFGCGLLAEAIDNFKPRITRNIKNRPGCEPCWQDAEVKNYAATVALPLFRKEHVFGVLNIYAEDGDAFDDDEVELLQELSHDLAFGIDSLRLRNERDFAVSEIKRLNEQLEVKVASRTRELMDANERLKELDKLKSMFIASMSHELRTPLNSIIGFSGIILNGLSGDVPPKQREQLERVHNSGKHLLELISDVIDIAKIEGDRIDIYPQHFMLNEVLDDVLNDNARMANRKNIALNIVTHENVAMFSDRKRLYQAINNLVSNGLKYTSEGEVRITVKDVYGMVEIAVKDTGIGIDKKDMGTLFQAFERLDSHLKIQEGGTGLGLYLTQKLVIEILHGEIQVDSEPGKGSTFYLRVAKDIREYAGNE